ncbi:MAG: hypothetical protein QXP42_00360 [Candidatus Micrarchaeia archaeon]
MNFSKAALVIFGIMICTSLAYADTNASESPKAVIVRINIKNDTFTILSEKIVYGYAPQHIVEWKDFRLKIHSDGGIINAYGIRDPRIRFYETLPADEESSEFGNPEGFKAVFVDEENLTLVFPFYSNLSAVSLHNYTTDEELLRADLKPLVRDFCSQHPADKECMQTVQQQESASQPAEKPPETAPAPSLLLIAVVVLASAFLIAAAILITLRKKKS